jgi:hypothetical protein
MSDAATRTPTRPRRSALRGMVLYLKGVRQIVAEANGLHRAWIREVGMLIERARTAPASEVATEASVIAGEGRKTFDEVRGKLAGLEVPDDANSCHTALTAWIDTHVAACEALAQIGQSADPGELRVVQGLLAEARSDYGDFNRDFAQLVDAVKKRLAAVREKRAARRTT